MTRNKKYLNRLKLNPILTQLWIRGPCKTLIQPVNFKKNFIIVKNFFSLSAYGLEPQNRVLNENYWFTI
jgi:hypothetical protein